jgi:leucyl aminopeptidase
MNIIIKQGDLLKESADLLALGVWQGTQDISGAAKAADKAMDGILTQALVDEEFGGKEGETLAVHTHGKLGARRVLLVGLGEKRAFGTETLRRAVAAVARYADKINAVEIHCELMANGLSPAAASQALTEGALLADYAYLAWKPQEARRLKKRGVSTLAIIENDAARIKAAEKGIALGEVMSRATIYARDLVNEPGRTMTPAHLKEHAERLAAHNRNIKLRVLDREACAKLGMGCFLAVAAGSDQEPYFLHLTYSPDKKKKALKKIALIGKGITFDSGGLSLKPNEAMETMKCDMAGAAAVLGVFSVLDDLEPDVEVHGLIAACENMPSGKAMRVGDIAVAMNGKSVEIMNTDAEGRLALADSLAFAEKKIKPDAAIDIATLTGACAVALGPDIAGIMSPDEKLATKLREAAQTAGERIWPLPLPREYASFVAGDHADLRNSSRVRLGGAITAGLFLREFAGSMSWAHLDIAGPAFAEREVNAYTKKGGTGFGVRLLLDLLKTF